jgi:hypothetical protein
MIERIPARGSCSRCQRGLGLTAAKVDGKWYGTATCAEAGECPLENRAPSVPEAALYTRSRRFFGKRRPKELKLGS